MPKIRIIAPCSKFQAKASLDQAFTQNTWYTLLDTTNAKLYKLAFMQLTADETIELRLTLDGVTISKSAANATAGTLYYVYLDMDSQSIIARDSSSLTTTSQLIEARSMKIEIRKTTAAGANNTRAIAIYGKW